MDRELKRLKQEKDAIMERAMDRTPGVCFRSLEKPFWANSPRME